MPRAKPILALLVCAACTATSWASILLPNTGQAGTWAGSQVEVSFLFGPSPALLDGSTWDSSAQAALDEWNAQMTVLRVVGSTGSGTVGGSRNGRNEAFFSSTVYGQAFGPNAAAITVIAYSGIPERNTEADVIFNTAYAWDSYRGPLRRSNGTTVYDFRRIALHEFGHLIGLDHADKFGPMANPAIMDTTASDLDQLAADDIAGVRLLYGPGEAPTYTDLSNLNVVATIGASQRITFSESAGTPFIKHQLYRNGAVLQTFYTGSNYLGSFTVNFDSTLDFGTYQIVASNRVGEVRGKVFNFQSDPAAIAPSIETDLHDITIAQGEARQIGIVASGNPAPSFTWFKNGVQLVGKNSSTIRLQGAAEDAGDYEILAASPSGSCRSAVARVTVLPLLTATNGWTAIVPESLPVRVIDAAFGNGVFVVVGGESGNVLTSSDGIQWTQCNVGNGARLNCAIFAAGRFVLGGSYDRKTGRTPIYVSFDGRGWMAAESGVDFKGAVEGIAYGAGRFVAVDLRGLILTSPDGLRWQAGPQLVPTGEYLNAIAFGNDRFVVTGRKDKVWVSPDGTTWTERNSGVPTGLNAITFGKGSFVAVGAYPDTRIDKAFVARSTDGATWSTSVAQSVANGPRIFYLNDGFHLTARGQDHLVSPDGVDWEQRNFTPGYAPVLSYGNGFFVALGGIDGRAFTSINGLHWTCTQRDDSRFSSAAFLNGRFLLFGTGIFDGGLVSSDGIAWQPMQIAGSYYTAAAYGGGQWVAVAGRAGTIVSTSRKIARSTDGLNWSSSTNTPQTDLMAVTYGVGRFVGVGQNYSSGVGGIAYSIDGASWTEIFPSGAQSLRSVTYGPGGFVAVGTNGVLLNSSDGISWQIRQSGTNRNLHAVACQGSRYVAVGGNGELNSVTVKSWDEPFTPNAVICTSVDGINWIAQEPSFEEPLFSIAHTGGTWIAGGLNGLLLFSADGTSWAEGPRASDHVWRMAAGNGMVVATGAGVPSNAIRLPVDALTKSIRFVGPPRVRTGEGGVVVSFDTTTAALQQVKWFQGATPVALSSGTSSVLPAPSVPAVYFAELSAPGHAVSRRPVVVAPGGTGSLSGDAVLVRADIRHPNGNVYDQYLLTGPLARLSARPGIITRVSFRDLTEDIVQVEFSGSGTLTIVLENPSPLGRPPNYNQDVDYVKGHARIFVSDADETSNISVFTVGRMTAVNEALFKSEVAYDGLADIGLLAIHSRNGRFGGARLGNASIWNRTDVTGLWAPDTVFVGPIILGDISGFDTATAGLVVRAASAVTIAGGDLKQANDREVMVDGTPVVQFTAGTNSHGRELSIQSNQARFMREGDDVTALMVTSH